MSDIYVHNAYMWCWRQVIALLKSGGTADRREKVPAKRHSALLSSLGWTDMKYSREHQHFISLEPLVIINLLKGGALITHFGLPVLQNKSLLTHIILIDWHCFVFFSVCVGSCGRRMRSPTTRPPPSPSSTTTLSSWCSSSSPPSSCSRTSTPPCILYVTLYMYSSG